MNLREGRVIWSQVVTGATAATAFPTSGSAGAELPTTPIRPKGTRIFGKIVSTVASGTATVKAHLYGYDGTVWCYLGSFNGGTLLTADATGRWGGNAQQIRICEAFAGFSPEAFARFTIGLETVGGTTPSVDAYVGFPTE